MRGVDFVQIPTTLLAQVDSSVGGKTAIDTPRGKNLVGAFHQPRLVLADIDVLATLPARQVKSGWAEVLKHGLICDAGFFDWLAGEGSAGAEGDPAALERAVIRSVEIKSAVVGEDEKEAGRRALLNLGHTFGHAVETEVGFDEDALAHGEAVALGCCMAFRYSAREGLCSAEDVARVEAVVAAAGLPTRLDQAGVFGADRLLALMAGDKKAEGGALTLILARGIGQAFVTSDVPRESVLTLLRDALAARGVDVDALDFEASYGRTSMEYYDGFVFGFYAEGRSDLPPVATGGRYDALTRVLGQGAEIPAVGGVIRPGLLLELRAAR